MPNPPILVTGATGTVGTEVVRQLVVSGQSVRALVRNPARAASSGDAVETVVGDLAKPLTLDAAFDGIDKVFVLAPPVPELERLEANALDAAKSAGVRQIVYLSNFGAGTIDVAHWRAHSAGEKRLRELGPAWTVLRPTRFMSNTPYAWVSVKEEGAVFEPTGDAKVTLIDPRDIAAVAVKTLTTPGHEGKVYELIGQSLTGTEIAQQISAALRRPVRFVDAPEDVARAWLLKAGFPADIAELVLYYFATLRDGLWYATSTAADLLGQAPRSYGDWLRDHPHWTLSQAASSEV